MKALVLSGGNATRLRPVSYRVPKQLVPVANKPVLQHVLEGIAELGITEVGLVVGPWRHRIAETLRDGSQWGLRISYIGQDEPRGERPYVDGGPGRQHPREERQERSLLDGTIMPDAAPVDAVR